MTVTVEVPTGHKWCKKCGGVFVIDAFPELSKRLADGRTVFYQANTCKDCKAEAVRRFRAKKQPAPEPPEEIAEKILDACFTGEQVVYRKGANIRWRRYGASLPVDAELLGRFNLGADYRDVLGAVMS